MPGEWHGTKDAEQKTKLLLPGWEGNNRFNKHLVEGKFAVQAVPCSQACLYGKPLLWL